MKRPEAVRTERSDVPPKSPSVTRKQVEEGRRVSLIFQFPMPENLTNRTSGRSHWRYVHGEKKRFMYRCDLLQRAGVLPPPPEKPMESASLSSVMHLGHAMDDDNALARHKWVLDWLKTRGYIVEDTKKRLRWTGLPEQIVKRKKRGEEYSITLTLTEEAA